MIMSRGELSVISDQYSVPKASRNLLALTCAALLLTAGAGEMEAAEPDVAAIKSLEATSFVVPDCGDMKMVLIKPGTFTMGSPENEVGRGDDEAQHKVTISKPFYMAEIEVTHGQYMPIMWPDFKPILVVSDLVD